jgi:hypothetical protein
MPVHDDQHSLGGRCPRIKGKKDMEEGEPEKIMKRE